jgi:hypothetical protein
MIFKWKSMSINNYKELADGRTLELSEKIND